MVLIAPQHTAPARSGLFGGRRSQSLPVEFHFAVWNGEAAHVDEDFQTGRWGADAEAMARREARWREMEAARVVLEAIRAT